MRLFNEEGAYPSCNYYRVVLYGYISCQNAPQALLFGLYSFFHPGSQRARSNIHGFIIMFIVTKLDIVNEEARCVYVCKLVEFAIWYLVSAIWYLDIFAIVACRGATKRRSCPERIPLPESARGGRRVTGRYSARARSF